MSVRWVEINFSTNLVIARPSFQDHVEAERLLHGRQAGRQAGSDAAFSAQLCWTR